VERLNHKPKEEIMKRGDIVNIYEDPNTEKHLEGRAKLIKKYPAQSDKFQECWLVMFLEPGYGDKAYRMINV
jgi:hypothetical protein